MPRAKKSGKSKSGESKHTGVRHRLIGAPHRVKTPGGGTRDFLDAGYTVDEKNNLYIVRLLADAEPTTLVVYSSGAWDSVELIINTVSTELPPAP